MLIAEAASDDVPHARQQRQGLAAFKQCNDLMSASSSALQLDVGVGGLPLFSWLVGIALPQEGQKSAVAVCGAPHEAHLAIARLASNTGEFTPNNTSFQTPLSRFIFTVMVPWPFSNVAS